MGGLCARICAFAASTSILAKIGVDRVNSNPATAIRTIVILMMV